MKKRVAGWQGGGPPPRHPSRVVLKRWMVAIVDSDVRLPLIVVLSRLVLHDDQWPQPQDVRRGVRVRSAPDLRSHPLHPGKRQQL